MIDAFGTLVRDEVDLDTLRAELLLVVGRTMQPTQAALWLWPQETSIAFDRRSAPTTVVDRRSCRPVHGSSHVRQSPP